LNPKKKIEGKFMEKLETNEEMEGTYNGVRMVTEKGVCKVKTLKKAHIS
jgi:hypothetical protein